MSDDLPPHLQQKGSEIRARLRDRLPPSTLLTNNMLPLDSTLLIPYSGRLKPDHLAVLDLDAEALVAALSAKRWTAVQVVEAYSISASVAHQSTNCLTWYDLDAAMRRAEELDDALEKTGKVVGPLHGVVISLKQLIEVKGWPQNASHFNFEEFIGRQDAQIVDILRRAGAIFMVKTTQPQSIMQLETDSHIYGRTCNAFNRTCTSGGSSGGEGALVAMKGSTMGVGTDIGGSIRNPAAMNGLWGFKSTSKRLPRDGDHGGLWGGTHKSLVRGCIGPLSRTRRDMDLFLQVIMAAECWKDDITLLPLPWCQVSDSGEGLGYKSWSGVEGKLRIGVMWDDGRVKPVKSVHRGMRSVVRRLGEVGSEVVDVDPFGFEESWDIITKLYYIDGGAKLRGILDDEPLLPLTEWVVSKSKPLSQSEIETLLDRRNRLRQAYLTFFRSRSLDVILLPAGPAPAQQHGTTKYWSYTSLFNLLDWPGAVFPTGLTVDPSLDADGDEGSPLQSARNEDERHLYDTYSPETSVGVPIGLQLVAPRYEDERLMAALKVVERALQLPP